ncbi:MAG TPA: response regulator receiver protein [Streptosporangiaceae bacterium]|jgi:hypothetical protein
MSSGVEADIALDAAVVLTLGLNRVLGRTAGLAASGANALAAFAEARAAARQDALHEIERRDQAVRAVLDRNAIIAALAESQRQAVERFGIDAVPLPEPLQLGAQPPGELAAWCAQIDTAIAEAGQVISRRVADAVAGRLFAAPAAGLTTAARAEPLQDHQSETAPASGADIAEALTRVVARLPPDTAEADHRSVAEAAERVARAATPNEAEGLLTEVRLRVQRANENTERRRAEAARAAAEQEAREQAEAERQYVLDAVTTAFADMGYEVDTGFETLTARDGEVLLTRGEWPQHAVKLKVDDASRASGGAEGSLPQATLRAALLRTQAPRSDDERRLDVEREQQWCDAFEAARTRLAVAGIRSAVRWRIEPGEQRLPVTEAPATRRATPKARERRREHD